MAFKFSRFLVALQFYYYFFFRQLFIFHYVCLNYLTEQVRAEWKGYRVEELSWLVVFGSQKFCNATRSESTNSSEWQWQWDKAAIATLDMCVAIREISLIYYSYDRRDGLVGWLKGLSGWLDTYVHGSLFGGLFRKKPEDA